MLNKYFWAALFWTIIITVCCLVSMKTFDNVEGVAENDKFAHFAFYFIFTFLWYSFFRAKKGNTASTRLIVFLLAFAFGLAIEACQEFFTKDRSADYHDVIANTSGSLGAILVLWLLPKFKKK